MHLHIPQMHIGGVVTATLGILGSLPRLNNNETRVFFILRADDWLHTDDFPLAFREHLGTDLTICYPYESPSDQNETLGLFSIVVSGRLRNPKGLLKSVMRKITRRVLPNTETNDDFPDLDDSCWDQSGESDDSYDGFRRVGLFSTDNSQSDQNQIDAEKGPYEPDEEH